MVTTFFKKKRKGEHNGHNCIFGKVLVGKGWSFWILDIFKNVHFRKPLAKCRILVFSGFLEYKKIKIQYI